MRNRFSKISDFIERKMIMKNRENEMPSCFTPNDNAYPLCCGANTPQGIAENDCLACCLYEDLDDDGIYNQHDN